MAQRLFHIGYEDLVLPIIATDLSVDVPANGEFLSWSAALGAMEWTAGGAGGVHDILSVTHTDTLAAAVSDGSLIIGNVTPKWSALAITVPVAGLINHLAVANAETRPSWKALFDATVPTTNAPSDAAAAGTAIVSARRDHQHANPATWAPSAHQLDGAVHTVSGLTAGHFLKALSATTFGFAAHGLTYTDVGADVAGAAAARQAAYTILTTLGTLADASGVLTNNGAGALSWGAGGAGDGSVDRVVATGVTRTILDQYSVVVADYIAVEGTGVLAIEGDGALGIL